MAKFVLKTATVTVNSVDLSDHISSVTVETTYDSVDVTAFGGEWLYRSSASSEGAGQVNRVHNRAAEVVGSGSDYALTGSTAQIDFGGTDAEFNTLPTAGTYLVTAVVTVTAVALLIHTSMVEDSPEPSVPPTPTSTPAPISVPASCTGTQYVSAVVLAGTGDMPW